MTAMTPTPMPATITLRLTPEDRAQLERDAAGMSLGAYIRWRVFDPERPPPRLRGKFPVKDHQALSKVLALFGQSRIANNLNQIAAAVNSGTLLVTPELEIEIRETRAYVEDIRRLLMHSVNMSDGAS